ncbi:hypothetical protein IFM89_019002 [Coptis chinensis]|uniref:Poly(A) polymerase n=1 Tax=Coptis chinensis TaxID=261450 RepID=A0A835M0L7_9MAGN|nr:hypothetical protein IFM89_019002 [Coptis chinensis]
MAIFLGRDSIVDDYVDKRKWRVVDSRIARVDRKKVSPESHTILHILRMKGNVLVIPQFSGYAGFKAYLVGGCVRDLLLDRIPKDFDVVTNANLKQIKKQFHRSQIVGKRFPICHVFIKGSRIEVSRELQSAIILPYQVSSFDTVDTVADGKGTVFPSQRPTGCNKEDFVRWKDCLRRDFTINSLFYDPSANKIYDYANGMRDLKLCKVQTVIPARVSFKEDCARILRGVRIAARLGLSFSKETAAAIQDLYMSILDMDKARVMLEMDYMLSYGSAKSSLSLLKRFKILDIVLPFHAAYLSAEAHDQTAQGSPMLFKLFASMDKLFASNRPSIPTVWVGVLAFHLALVNNPQDALVVWALSSIFYHGNWKEAVEFAREKSKTHVDFSPEISQSCSNKSDKALAEDVKQFASQVISSIDALTEPQSLFLSMERYPLYPCFGSGGLTSDLILILLLLAASAAAAVVLFVFISKHMGRTVAELFEVLLDDVDESQNRSCFEIDYELLKQGNHGEIRFVLGKVIMDTLGSVSIHDQLQELQHLPLSHSDKQQKVIGEEMRKITSRLNRRKVFENEKEHSPGYNNNCQVGKEEKQRSQKSNIGIISVSHLEHKRKVGSEETSCLMISHLEQRQVDGNKKDHLQNSNSNKRKEVFEREKDGSIKLDIDTISSSHVEQSTEVVKKDNSFLISSHPVQERDMAETDCPQNSNTRKLLKVFERCQMYSWKQKQHVVKENKNNQSESNQEPQPVVRRQMHRSKQKQQVVKENKHHQSESNREPQAVVGCQMHISNQKQQVVKENKHHRSESNPEPQPVVGRQMHRSKQKQQVVKESKHHQSESNREPQAVVGCQMHISNQKQQVFKEKSSESNQEPQRVVRRQMHRSKQKQQVVKENKNHQSESNREPQAVVGCQMHISNQKQQVVKENKHHRSESNPEPQAVVSIYRKLSSLFV